MSARVCKLTNIHSPLDQRIFHKEAQSLVAAGYEVTIIGPGPIAMAGLERGVHIQTIPPAHNFRQRVFNLFRLLREGWKVKADFYHFHDPELLPLGVFLRLLGKRAIYDVHEHFPQAALVRTWIPAGLRRSLSVLVDVWERLLAGCLSGVVGVVEEQGGRFGGCLFAAVKNYPRLEWFQSNGHSQAPVAHQLIHVGSLSRERGGLFLLEIMKVLRETHPDVRLLCIGRFHTEPVQTLFLQKLEEYQLHDQVTCHTEPVPYEELGRVIQASKIGLIPGQVSVQNLAPFVPTKLFEYLACGLPVVASALPSIRNFYAEADWGGVVEPADPRAHARAIRCLLDSPLEARAKGDRGRSLVESRFNWDLEAEKLLNLYQEVLLRERR